MDIEQALELANNVLSGQMNRRLSDVETLILRGAWDRQTYEDIAATSSYAESYIRKDAGPKLWRDLATALGEPLSKTNFRAALERRWDKPLTLASPVPPSIPQTDYLYCKTDWGEAMDVSVFFGRSVEQETLTQWVSTDRCRFILLLGMGGIGKTALSIKVGQQVQSDFEFVIWRSLRNAPPILDLLADLIKFLSQQQDVQIPSTAEAGVSQLLQYLRQHRCLLMLDNAESILQAGDRKRSYRPEYEGYGQLFQKVGETSHPSCLMVTSRELPQGLEKQIGKELPVRSLTISGLLRHDGQAFLESIAKFQGSAAEWEAILQRYAGNPLALKIVASFINEILAGDLSQFFSFLGESSFIFDNIRDLLDQQFLRLSLQEQAVMIWLAIKREPVTLAELAEDLVEPISPPELLQVMMALQGRALIEKTKNQFTQQPVVMEYVTDAFIEQISQQICGWQAGDSIGELNGLRDYALIHIDAQEYVRESQRRLILKPIIQKLLAHFREVSHLAHHVQHILAALRGNSPQKMGYGAGNILNLLSFLQVDLTGYDFSRLTLW
ncbi:MAG: NB-ARC domain-containing protein, partial [Thermosynechococcaceae cyanobacterium]